MASPLKSKICISSVTNGGVTCSSPVITILDGILPDGVLINCELDSNNCFEVSVIADDVTGLAGLCVPVVIQCEDCGVCDPLETTICFCEDNNDCDACQDCIGGFCEDRCPDQECDNGTCVNCVDDEDCPNNQICVAGNCQCPPDMPFMDEFGNCKECQSDANCPDCTECVNGDCLPIVCSTGACDPETNNCVECINSGDCTKANECCVDKECECCDGYVRNLVTGECEEAPDCVADEDCPECFICDGGDCIPQPCPDGQICVGGECLPICPCEESDCIGDSAVCVPHPTEVGVCYCNDCSKHDCAGSDCNNGCECVGDECVPSECYEDAQNVALEWVKEVSGSPGNSLGALGVASVSAVAGDLIQNGGAGSYRDYTISIAATNTQSGVGQWYVSTQPGSLTPVTAIGDPNAVVRLQDIDDLTFGFYLIYREDSNCHRSIKVPVVLNQQLENPLQAPEDGWLVLTDQIVNSGGCSYGGSLSTSWKLCIVNGGDFVFSSNTPVETGGDGITINFSGAGSSCLLASIAGCGNWTGKLAIECGDLTINVTAPEFVIDELCCSIDCGGPGETCDTPTNVNLPINVFYYYGASGVSSSDAVAMVDLFDGSVTFDEVYNIASQMCWGSSDNGAISNDAIEATGSMWSVANPNSNPMAYQFSYSNGTCVHVGQDCVIETNCKIYSGQKCLEKCEEFDTLIVPRDVSIEDTETIWYILPNNTAVAYYSQPVSTQSFDSSGVALGGALSFVPVAGAALGNLGAAPFYTVNGPSFNTYYGMNEIELTLNRTSDLNRITFNSTTPCPTDANRSFDVYGCTNSAACNYNANATVDDGSCEVLATTITYVCDGTGLIVTPTGCLSPYNITITGGSLLDEPYVSGMLLDDGSYNITVEDQNGYTKLYNTVISCCDSSFSIDAVPYSCNVASTETLTTSGVISDGETVVIDGKTYTFKTVLTDTDGFVLIGGTEEESLDNLIAAITLSTGAGSIYAASTTIHPTVTAEAGAGTTMDVTALVPGTAGDSITTVETMVNGAFGAGNLSGGTQSTMTLQFSGGATDYTIEATHVGGTMTLSPSTPLVQVGDGDLVFTITDPVTNDEEFDFTITDANGCVVTYRRTISCCTENCVLGSNQTTELTASAAEVTITDNTTYYTYRINEAVAGIGELNTIATNLQTADSIVVLNMNHISNPSPVGTDLFYTNGIIGTPIVNNLGTLAELEFNVSKSYLFDPSCCESTVDTRVQSLAENFVTSSYPNTGQFSRFPSSDAMSVDFNIFSYDIDCCAPTI